jgi:hypothetical protein
MLGQRPNQRGMDLAANVTHDTAHAANSDDLEIHQQA